MHRPPNLHPSFLRFQGVSLNRVIFDKVERVKNQITRHSKNKQGLIDDFKEKRLPGSFEFIEISHQASQTDEDQAVGQLVPAFAPQMGNYGVRHEIDAVAFLRDPPA
jgi:hypothetical protein